MNSEHSGDEAGIDGRDAACLPREVERLREALAEIARRGALCIHQNTGCWDMTVEHDRRSYNVLASNNEIALAALASQGKDRNGGEG
ncbi:MAG TPA: hypothetical protein VF637_05825 [Sphingomicrobium sp.]|jgi:hypothetical protein